MSFETRHLLLSFVISGYSAQRLNEVSKHVTDLYPAHKFILGKIMCWFPPCFLHPYRQFLTFAIDSNQPCFTLIWIHQLIPLDKNCIWHTLVHFLVMSSGECSWDFLFIKLRPSCHTSYSPVRHHIPIFLVSDFTLPLHVTGPLRMVALISMLPCIHLLLISPSLSTQKPNLYHNSFHSTVMLMVKVFQFPDDDTIYEPVFFIV